MIKKIVFVLAIATIFVISIIVILIAADKLNQARCYNLPLNDFYKDKNCLKYLEENNE